MNKYKKITLFVTCFSFICIMSTLYIYAWGDNSTDGKGRPNYTKSEIDAGALGDTITFNSISNNSSLGDGENGNEKYFVAAREYNDTDTSHQWQAGSINIEDGKEYVIRMYVHNNSPKGRDAVAKDVRSYFKIPNYSSKNIEVTGYLDSSNATPTMYWDEINFKSDLPFHLEYVGGSATLTNNILDNKDNPTGEVKKTALSDEIVTNKNGVLIGSESLNGEVPGCFEYTMLVTIRVKAYIDKDYTVDTKVRFAGGVDKTWKKSIDAKPGDKIEFLINYTNTSDEWQRDVVVRDILPSNLRYIKGSTRILNGSHPEGAVVNEDDLVDDGIFIGSYASGANCLTRFYAEITESELLDEEDKITNWGQVIMNGNIIQDSATIAIEHDNTEKTKKHTAIIIILSAVFLVIVIVMAFYVIRRLKHCDKYQ